MKKRILSLLLSLALLISLAPAALAASPTQVVALKINSPWCVIGSETTTIDTANDKVVPVAESGRTLVPMARILEAFGGSATWVPETHGVLCSLNGIEVELTLNTTTALVNGESVTLDVPAKAMNSRTFVPVRFVSESLGLTVQYEPTNQIVVVADGDVDASALTSLSQVKTLIEKTTPKAEPTTLTQQSYALPSGTVSAKVITVNMSDPRVSVKAALPDNKLNNTRAFSDICAASGAVAVINANYFQSYNAIKDPIGHVMVNGQFLYGSTGLNSLGITADNKMTFGRPAMFFRVKTTDGGKAQEWSGYECNVLSQFANQSVLYTPARGASFPVTYPGAVLVVENGVTTNYRTVASGETITIPANGFVLYSSNEVTSTAWYQIPEMGRAVTIEPYLFANADSEGFELEGVQSIVSGGPILIKDGAVVSQMESLFANDTSGRFSVNGSAPRTAVGATADNKLVLVSVSSGTIQQMRELMSQLGCVDAFCLDGGGSTAMYYKGQTLASPGRQLTTTLQVFVSE